MTALGVAAGTGDRPPSDISLQGLQKLKDVLKRKCFFCQAFGMLGRFSLPSDIALVETDHAPVLDLGLTF